MFLHVKANGSSQILRKYLKSILTISEDFTYGEVVKISYKDLPTQIYHLPSFIGAIRTASIAQPEMIILDFRQEGFLPAKAFLDQLLEMQVSNPVYSPDIFLRQASAALLRDVSRSMTQSFYQTSLPGVSQEIGVVVEPCELENLIKKLRIAIRRLR